MNSINSFIKKFGQVEEDEGEQDLLRDQIFLMRLFSFLYPILKITTCLAYWLKLL